MIRKAFLAISSVAMLTTAAPVWAARPFSNRDLRGTYAEKFSGSAAGAANPFPASSSTPQSGTGIQVADGNGNFTSKIIFSIGGSTCSGTVAGTYVVNADGTGTSTGTFTPNATAPSGVPASNYLCPAQITGVQNAAFTIVGHGKIEFISTDADSVIVGTAQRQTH
jgi:hypothetical protein